MSPVVLQVTGRSFCMTLLDSVLVTDVYSLYTYKTTQGTVIHVASHTKLYCYGIQKATIHGASYISGYSQEIFSASIYPYTVHGKPPRLLIF